MQVLNGIIISTAKDTTIWDANFLQAIAQRIFNLHAIHVATGTISMSLEKIHILDNECFPRIQLNRITLAIGGERF
jgi:hypothetical protein